MSPTPAQFIAGIRQNRFNTALLQRLPALNIPHCHLVAGCLFQTWWNLVSGRPAEENINDYDVFYFDDSDLSWDAEDAVIRLVAAATDDLGVKVEVRNQARVHLWFEAKFGAPCPSLASVHAGIDQYLVPCTCVGIDVASGDLYAPNGLDDLHAGILKRNPKNPSPQRFLPKVEDYLRRWPWLTISA